ncbi:DUF5996 family protein [Streptomyces sp. DSM 44917]|uniref:DUF5996 family protein n=1 Tax=Streptomyces boetiae TaxID=3075541 RepID=A0ABU2LB08_9ACTN|nr:DUF5996 family protein [Streptomyces sp. DSM 44917]MDT0308670.1 DUF5996 family protein [Streptomyces sp. DSM 44917]
MKPATAVEYPAFPLDAWRPTKETVHRFLQIVGKIRLAAGPRRNHWWHVPFHLTGCGITTRPTRDPASRQLFAIDFDFVGHRLLVRTLAGNEIAFPLAGHSVANFYALTTTALGDLGLGVRPRISRPYGLPDADRPFAQDTEHRSYDQDAVSTYWRILSRVALELEVAAARYAGKISPVHHFWHTFDIAVTRFSDRQVDTGTAVDPVTREAYSREVISSGFWFGDDETPEPAFYAYTAPEPDGLANRPLAPDAARWLERGGSHLALLPYEAVRAEPDPGAAIQAFYDSSYRAGAELAGWPPERECPDGVTDPVLLGPHRLSR